jgi:hypothetical protein
LFWVLWRLRRIRVGVCSCRTVSSHLVYVVYLTGATLAVVWFPAVGVEDVVNAAEVVVAVVLLISQQDARLHGAKVR